MIALALTLSVGFVAGWMLHDAIMSKIIRKRFHELSAKYRLYPK